MQRYDLHILALLDRCDLSDEEIEDLFANTDTPLIATCRIVEVGATAPGQSMTSARAPVISPLGNELPIPCADRPLWTSPGGFRNAASPQARCALRRWPSGRRGIRIRNR